MPPAAKKEPKVPGAKKAPKEAAEKTDAAPLKKGKKKATSDTLNDLVEVPASSKRAVSPQIVKDPNEVANPFIPLPPNSFENCTPTERDLMFPDYFNKCGLADMIIQAFGRLEREIPRPADPWEWLRWRIFMGKYSPGDKQLFAKTIQELIVRRDKLIKEKQDLIKAKVKREEIALASLQNAAAMVN